MGRKYMKPEIRFIPCDHFDAEALQEYDRCRTEAVTREKSEENCVCEEKDSD